MHLASSIPIGPVRAVTRQDILADSTDHAQESWPQTRPTHFSVFGSMLEFLRRFQGVLSAFLTPRRDSDKKNGNLGHGPACRNTDGFSARPDVSFIGLTVPVQSERRRSAQSSIFFRIRAWTLTDAPCSHATRQLTLRHN